MSVAPDSRSGAKRTGALDGGGLDHDADVVPAVVEERDPPADEAVGTAVEERHAVRAVAPRDAGELVGVVARRPAEALGEVVVVRR